MDGPVLASLQSLEGSIDSLLTCLTATNTFTGATTAAHNIISADDALTSGLNLLKKHQDNYRRILQLRSEADKLHAQLRNIIRLSNELHAEAGGIHPSILEGDHAEEAEHVKAQDVDYNTLLSFAARIGKHNAAAAREAEQESAKRRADLTQTKTGQVNGIAEEGHNEPNSQTATTQESQAALAAISDAMALQRAAIGMAFPPPDRLRMGVLGQLQLLREQEGEDAVERAAMKMVQDSENVSGTAAEGTQSDVDDAGGQRERLLEPAHSYGPTNPQPLPKEQKKINLDFDEFNSDEDD